MSLAVASGGARAGEVNVDLGLSAQETLSDNIDLEPDGEADTALLSEIIPDARVRWDGARVNAALDGTVNLRHQAGGEDQGVSALPTFNALGTVEVAEDLFFIDATAVASREVLNTRQGDTESNNEFLQNYSVSPYLLQRFGRSADAQLRYTYDQVLSETESSDSESLSDGVTHSLNFDLTSGEDFTSLLWSVNAFGSTADRSAGRDVDRRRADLTLEYVIDRSISLIGGGGYEFFDDGNPRNEFEGPTWKAGLRWRPGSRTELRATYGRRQDNESLEADFRYDISPRTRFEASYDEILQTGQERLARGSSFLGLSPDSSDLIDTRTQLPFDQDLDATSLFDETTRTKTLRVSLSGTRGRNAFGLIGLAQDQEEEGGSDLQRDEEAISVRAFWNRQLSRKLDLELDGTYERNEFQSDGREDNEYRIGSRLNYSLYSDLEAFAAYSFRTQDSTSSIGEFTENRFLVGVRTTF